MAALKIIFGGSVIGVSPFDTSESVEALYKALEAGGCDAIDTATVYGENERLLAEYGAPGRFPIDSKTPGGSIPGQETQESMKQNAETSHRYLGKLDIWYLHTPSNDYPLEKTLETVDELHKKGYFSRFGLSNFLADDVQRVYDMCKAKGYVLPTVYQGNYNAAARGIETIFPTLRTLGISFYAYSPIAGGFLTKTKQDITEQKGRFNPSHPLGAMYMGMYSRPALLEALSEWESIAEEDGQTRAELAFRWLAYNSLLSDKHGDGILVGAGSIKQVESSLANLKKGPVSEKAAKRIDGMWQLIKDEAPLDNIRQ